jgi:diguanylate cyclase (GGDEF)-like protein/PAS domain S-box-containing protein
MTGRSLQRAQLVTIFDPARYAFSPYAVPTALTSVSMLVFGSTLLLRRVTRITLSFFGLTAAAAAWLLAFTVLYCAADARTALVWARLPYVAVPLIAPAIYQFIVELLRISRARRKRTAAGWILGLVFVAVSVPTPLLVTHVEHFWWGWYPRFGGAATIPFLAFFFGYLIAALLELVAAFPASGGIERQRIRMMIVAFAVAYAGCIDYLPALGIPAYPIGYVPVLAFIVVAAVAFHRYDIIAITPSLAAREIIGTMADALFVCGRDGEIQLVNAAAKHLLGYDEHELIGRPLENLLAPEDREIFAETLRRRTVVGSEEHVFQARNGARIEMTVSIAPVLDGGDPAGAIMIGRDMRERKEAESALRESELRYRLLFEQNAAGVCVAALDGTIHDCNDTFAALLGYTRAELQGMQLGRLFVRPLGPDELASLLNDRPALDSFEVEMRRRDGGRVWALQNLTLSGGRIHGTFVDISARKLAEETIEFHAYHDVLTNLPNRKLFLDRLSLALTRSRRSAKPLAVMFVDLDRFKSINDTLGHTAGDELLLEMSRRLRSCVRGDDTVARLGGDEFTIILAELRHPEDAANVAEKILASIEQPLVVAGTPIEVSASIGIALFPADGNDAESLLRNADRAMYRAKQEGRNTYQLCTDDMKRRAVERISLESRLRRALHDRNLVLHYQPQVSLATGKVIGAEALVRWNDPERGLVHPSSFIPVAEESLLILPLGEWVLRTACEQMREWRDAGIDVGTMAVNLSPRQFQHHDLLSLVRRTLAETGLDGNALEIEITESTAMQNADASLDLLRALRSLGVGVSLDDFGTGYSSLNYLKRFPITSVKIDRLFVREVDTSEEDAAIVSAVIGIARHLRLRVVAEGVETAGQAAFLRKRRCDAAQGYLFSRPVSAENIPAVLAQRPDAPPSRALGG